MFRRLLCVLVAAVVILSSAPARAGRVVRARERVEGQYIVTVKESSAKVSRELADRMAAQYGAANIRGYLSSQNPKLRQRCRSRRTIQ